MAADDDDEFDWGVLGGIEKVEEVKKARNLSEPVLFSFGFGKDGVLGLGDEKNRFLATGGDFRLQQIAAGKVYFRCIGGDRCCMFSLLRCCCCSCVS